MATRTLRRPWADGAAMGEGAPPTGKTFKVQSIQWRTLKDELILEHRASRDGIGMMQQLSLLPMSPRYDLPEV
ncbi:MAG: hypothetical protein P4L64_03425 [Caulobacteraceae bacterium]|nr:hypothetical protein [Caulobacteraceae bacterium]